MASEIPDRDTTKTAETGDDKPEWFAMRVTYCRELAVKEMLDTAGIESYIPMVTRVSNVAGRKACVKAPAIHNLIFVRTTRNVLKEFKTRLPYFQYMMRTDGAKREVITVPPAQMAAFIAISSRNDSSVVFLTPDQIDLPRGVRVKIHGGPLNGIEGLFVKVKGRRQRRIVIIINGVAAVAAEVSPDLIEILD